MGGVASTLSVFLVGTAGFGALTWLVRRLADKAFLESHNTVIELYLVVAAALFGVYLAFVTVSVWEQQNRAALAARRESADLLLLYRLAGAAPAPSRKELQDAVRDYAHSIISEEWPQMLKQDVGSLAHRSANLDRLWNLYTSLAAPAPGQPALLAESIAKLEDLVAARETRLLFSATSLSPYIWFTLIIGAAINMALLQFIAAADARSQAFITGLCGGLVCILLFVIYQLQTPYVGNWGVSPEAFELASQQMLAGSPR